MHGCLVARVHQPMPQSGIGFCFMKHRPEMVVKCSVLVIFLSAASFRRRPGVHEYNRTCLALGLLPKSQKRKCLFGCWKGHSYDKCQAWFITDCLWRKLKEHYLCDVLKCQDWKLWRTEHISRILFIQFTLHIFILCIYLFDNIYFYI